MQIAGDWMFCDDGIIRPVIRGEIRCSSGAWIEAPFLLDTGADKTVFSAAILGTLALSPTAYPGAIGGVGGVANSVLIETQIMLPREQDGKVIFRGQYAALTDAEALDVCVLGRDITNLFSVIVDYPGSVVCLLGQRHQYTIIQT